MLLTGPAADDANTLQVVLVRHKSVLSQWLARAHLEEAAAECMVNESVWFPSVDAGVMQVRN